MRRFAVPLGIVVLAVVLGLVLAGPNNATAKTDGGTSGAVLAADSAPSVAPALVSGETLFEENCSSCHGADAQGSALAPNLRGLGAATVDLWVSSGWMPLRNPTSQPIKKPSLFSRTQTVEIANFVGSIAGGPPIPNVNLAHASLASGFSIFALNCAPCHTITGAGDALSNGLTAPPLHGLSPTEVAEAVETGPGNMPHFSAKEIDPTQVTDVVAYVTEGIQHPANPGGLGLGGVGPVAEGFVGLFIGVGACMLVALWIGDRTERDEEEHHEPAHGSHDA